MAHEATHVAQQNTSAAGALVDHADVTDYLPDVSVTDLIPDWILDGVRAAVRAIPGYTLLTYITGTDPLTDEPVSVSPAELIETLLTYGPVRRGGRPGAAGDRRPRRDLRLRLRAARRATA